MIKFAFYGYDNELPDELIKDFKDSGLQRLLTDGDDNTCTSVLYINCSKSTVQELFSCVLELTKDDYIQEAKEQGIIIKQ